MLWLYQSRRISHAKLFGPPGPGFCVPPPGERHDSPRKTRLASNNSSSLWIWMEYGMNEWMNQHQSINRFSSSLSSPLITTQIRKFGVSQSSESVVVVASPLVGNACGQLTTTMV